MRTAFAIALSFYVTVAHTQVYRWVDARGSVHYGDTVPDPFKAGALLVEPRITQPTPEQIDAAKQRAERERLEAAQRKDFSATASAPSSPSLSVRASAADPQSCEAKWRKYIASSECYAPFFLHRGGLRPGAFETCGPAVAEPQCE